jgi:cytochrome oxidase assembly protein ShyY1
MMPGVKQKLHFDFEWRLALFTALLVPLMVGLGFWQLQRGDDKAALSAAFETREQQQPALLATLWDAPTDALSYAPVRLLGRFMPDAYFLRDNQVRSGVFGYEVLSVLQLADEAGGVLVNRGWIAGNPDRIEMPQVPKIDEPIEIVGHVYVAPGKPFLLAEQQFSDTWPKLIQAVEMDKMIPEIAALGINRVFPYPVRINAGEPGALAADWQVVNMSPVKHQGYAVQWFAMAAVLFLFYLFRSSNLWQVLRGQGAQTNQ